MKNPTLQLDRVEATSFAKLLKSSQRQLGITGSVTKPAKKTKKHHK